MIKSVLHKTTKYCFLAGAILAGLLYASFKPGPDDTELLAWSNKCFTESYDTTGMYKLKSWQLTLTGDAFIRLRKIYKNGKEEYYSFHLQRFNDMAYLGTTTSGTLQLKTIADDIIVQTYNDPKGDIDSVATQLNLPFKNMEPQRLDSLQTALNYFKNKSL
jgi:hypothetical protein